MIVLQFYLTVNTKQFMKKKIPSMSARAARVYIAHSCVACGHVALGH